jgi:hypothetical protein
MRIVARWAAVIAIVGVVGFAGAERYAKLLAPAYEGALRLLAGQNAWDITRFTIDDSGRDHAVILRVGGTVHRTADPSTSSATVNVTRPVGSLIELAVVFWVLVLGWPVAERRQRLVLVAIGVPVLLLADIASTGCSLAGQFADARAMLQLAADTGAIPEVNEAWTLWERWSRFLEGGGRIVIGVVLALAVIACCPAPRRGGVREAGGVGRHDAGVEA